jgi:uncharacterized membrane protein
VTASQGGDQLPATQAGSAGDTTSSPSLERFNGFSDGVFAIAITLLVLELPVPPSTVAVAPALLEAKYDFLAYLISFAFIGGMWLTHSSLTKVMKRCDNMSAGMNLTVLFFVAILPFSTSLMVTHLSSPDAGTAVIVYGVNVFLASLMLSLLMIYVAQEPALAPDGIADERIKKLYRRRWLVLGTNAFAIAVAMVSPPLAVGLYLVTAVTVLFVPLLSLRHRRHPPH